MPGVKRENFSKKRMAILNALCDTSLHPTAEWVYRQLRPGYPDLSLGTVYRNLRLFCETGKIASLGVINGQEHFDAIVAPHAHFVCERCGAISDVKKDFFGPEELGQISQHTGMDVRAASVLFRGLCQSCRREEARQPLP